VPPQPCDGSTVIYDICSSSSKQFVRHIECWKQTASEVTTYGGIEICILLLYYNIIKQNCFNQTGDYRYFSNKADAWVKSSQVK